jgi:hypothetical protein
MSEEDPGGVPGKDDPVPKNPPAWRPTIDPRINVPRAVRWLLLAGMIGVTIRVLYDAWRRASTR